jgi:hypothetical protein
VGIRSAKATMARMLCEHPKAPRIKRAFVCEERETKTAASRVAFPRTRSTPKLAPLSNERFEAHRSEDWIA